MRAGDGSGDVPDMPWHWGCWSPTLLSPPSLDFSYQEQPESSGSELEEVMALQPPSSQGRAW